MSSSSIYFYLHFTLLCLCLQARAIRNSEHSKRKKIKFIFWYILRTAYKAEQFPECLSTAHSNSINHTASKVSTSWWRDGGYRRDPVQPISLLYTETLTALAISPFFLNVLQWVQWSGQSSSFKSFRHLWPKNLWDVPSLEQSPFPRQVHKWERMHQSEGEHLIRFSTST